MKEKNLIPLWKRIVMYACLTFLAAILIADFYLLFNKCKPITQKYTSIMHQSTTSAFGLFKCYTIVQAEDGSLTRIDGLLPIGDTILITK